MLPVPLLLQRVQRLGHLIFTSGELNLNLIGQRSASNTPGSMDDILSVVWMEAKGWHQADFICTLDPGMKTFKETPNPDGAPWIDFGQYRGAYEIGEHKGRPALRQVGEITIRRDRNKNGVIDRDSPQTKGLYGMHIHDGKSAEWSEGCTVTLPESMRFVYDLAVRASTTLSAAGKPYGNRFTFTVIPAG